RRFAAVVCLSADVGRFGFADAFWRSCCRLAPTLFTKKAWQSVAHLTFTDTCWSNYECGIQNSELKILLLITHSELRIPNSAQRRAGRPRSSPFPLRGK
ncbi:MAG: hypothetical protein LBQ66_09270, partial [Planctomycetaceae bacterium]|nr:hypothetical protein [Planctomycetaceae bacterium]